MKAITKEMVHEWHLEACKEVNDLNPITKKMEEKEWENLSIEERAIFDYMSDKINEHLHLVGHVKIEFCDLNEKEK